MDDPGERMAGLEGMRQRTRGRDRPTGLAAKSGLFPALHAASAVHPARAADLTTAARRVAPETPGDPP